MRDTPQSRRHLECHRWRTATVLPSRGIEAVSQRVYRPQRLEGWPKETSLCDRLAGIAMITSDLC